MRRLRNLAALLFVGCTVGVTSRVALFCILGTPGSAGANAVSVASAICFGVAAQIWLAVYLADRRAS